MKIAINVILWLFLYWVFTSFNLPYNTLFWNALQNSGHGLVFLLITFIAINTFVRRNSRKPLLLVVILIIVFLLGVLIELAQHYSGRGASSNDLIMNSVGIVIGAALCLQTNGQVKLAERIVLVPLTIVLISWCLHKPAILLVSNLISPSLPVVMNFESIASPYKIHTDKTRVQISEHQPTWPDNNTKSIKVTFSPGRESNFGIMEPPKNWSNYNWLTFRAFSQYATSKKLILRVDDQSIGIPDYSFMTISVNVPTGSSLINVPLEQLASDKRLANKPSLDQITVMYLYIPDNETLTTLYFDDFELKL